MNHFKYNDLFVGQKEEFIAEVTQEKMEMFYALTSDDNPLHRSEQFAKQHGYKACVVYGMLTSSFLSTFAGVYLPGEFCLIQSVESKFTKPVYIGDRLTISGVISELHDSVQQAVIKVKIANQNQELVCKAKIKVGVLDGK